MAVTVVSFWWWCGRNWHADHMLSVAHQMSIDVNELINVDLVILIGVSVFEPHFQVLINICNAGKASQHGSDFLSRKKTITIQINSLEKVSGFSLDLKWDVVVEIQRSQWWLWLN